ncbi:MAG: hypothetical protein NTV04_06385 [Deltaproteobacteria bacterium]|nr:hypothetical protein [Deltaproteobacteria bacterium]
MTVTLQGRGAGCKLCCGLGVRAVRAGSIGREAHSPGERTELPPKEGPGGLGPRPIHEETSASWFQADRPDPQAMEALCLYAEPSSRASNPPSLKGYE